jgi:multiple sugar transport system permease protein
MNKSKKELFGKIILIFLLFLVFLSILVPYLWTISNAFRFNDEIGVYNNLGVYTFVPKAFTMSNFRRMFDQLNMWRIIFNTLLVAFSTTLMSLFINALTGYALGLMNFIGKKFIFALFISMMMFPIEVLIIPLYLTINDLHLNDSYFSLILPFLATPFGIFFMRQFFQNQPKSLGEAAKIDGANQVQIFMKVYLPLAKTPLMTLGLLTFMQQWDSFIVPVTFINDESKLVLQVALTRLSAGLYMTDYGVLFAGVTLSIIPILIIYLLTQRHIQENIAMTGIK